MSRMKDIATEELLKQRGESWGDAVDTHERIALVWSGILNTDVTPYQVALCMSGLKLVRAEINPSDPDSLDDCDGYSSIARDCHDAEAKAAAEEAQLTEPPLMPNWVQESLAEMLTAHSPISTMFGMCFCDACNAERAQQEQEPEDEIGVATMGAWFEVPLLFFGMKDEGPTDDSNE